MGLGNPGARYEATRHNAGRLVLDVLAGRVAARFARHPRANAEVAEVRFGALPGRRVVLARPRTFMNDSGGPVAGLAAYYGVDASGVLVVHDELDLEPGTVRIKVAGGDGGHNGLKSIRSSLGTGDTTRVRVGIGRPPGRQDAADYVLKDFSPAERRELGVTLEVAADAVEAVVLSGAAAAQNTFNA